MSFASAQSISKDKVSEVNAVWRELQEWRSLITSVCSSG
jgi:hypothetical protein